MAHYFVFAVDSINVSTVGRWLKYGTNNGAHYI